MLFNSFKFLIFFPLICIVYFLLPYKYRNVFLLIASYYFYMNWEPVYAILIFFSSLTTYLVAQKIGSTTNNSFRKGLLVGNLVVNFGILFVFKYYNFLTESIFEALQLFGMRMQIPKFQLLLPVGISFYTFQAIGYTIDVYRKSISVEKRFVNYMLFVSFFPQLVAGPIERAKNLLPQFRTQYDFDYERAISGIKQMLWGFFMKVVVADRVSIYVDAVFDNYSNHSGSSLLLASLLFAIQIYCDFAGYSNIAIGAARIMGFDLMENFRRPYFATSFKEFWKRWHISLSTWFGDYVYIPLGGNRVTKTRHYRNLVITFLVSGMWHGANWTFLMWGGLHGIYLIGELLAKSFFLKLGRVFNWFVTIVGVVLGWIFFRAESIDVAFSVIHRILFKQGPLFLDKTTLSYGFLGVIILLLKDFIDEFYSDFAITIGQNTIARYAYVLSLTCAILLIGVFNGGQFIYFQF
ncbi:MBOAT family protein [Puteibacter caeruleilacunae]|nr:MBOAT family protein [Puteibacter caeruleilacunae]